MTILRLAFDAIPVSIHHQPRLVFGLVPKGSMTINDLHRTERGLDGVERAVIAEAVVHTGTSPRVVGIAVNETDEELEGPIFVTGASMGRTSSAARRTRSRPFSPTLRRPSQRRSPFDLGT